MNPKRVYIPFNSHRDNRTGRWKDIVFLKDNKVKSKRGRVYKISLENQIVEVKVERVLQDGWYECRCRKPKHLRRVKGQK